MIYESATITLTCDRKDCGALDRVNAADRDRAMLILYKLGWRMVRRQGKCVTLCPGHAARESRRLAAKL